ncbi:MAG: DNA/RNA nuclease SfsA [Clostridia bacterium]|nr:DNA/RNA nuclease SfsA [Clostridia bacterium]
MKLYDEVLTGTFLRRPNRFIAHVQTKNGLEICHVKNTGRCAELLVPGAEVTLAVGKNPGRKTRCDLVAVQKGSLYINMDSQAPNRAAAEALPRLFPGLTLLRPEAAFGASRLDFYLERGDKKTFVEVKGVTLEENGLAFFPDAPTERGVKHLKELENCLKAGFGAAVLFVIQMQGVTCFAPNRKTHPAFAEALLHAQEAGVQVLAYDCDVTPDSMTVRAPVSIRLK